MKTKKWLMTNGLLLIALAIAIFLRLYKLGSIPPHLTPDEAALGYNAYSILKTGRDEYGQILPVIFKSFGDYKPGLYIYTTVPVVTVFGLNEWSVRLPSALAGIIAVLLLYLIVRELFNDDKLQAIFASFLLAISPWHIHFSRGAWEANLSLTLTLAGIYLFLKSLKNSKLLIINSILFALTFLTYQGAKLSTPIVIFLLVVIYFKEIINKPKKALIAFLVIILISFPIILSFFQGGVGRARVFNIFSVKRPLEALEIQLAEAGEGLRDLNYFVFHSETLNIIRGILGRWSNHFSARFLFFEGDWSNPRHSAPYNGELIFLDLVLLIFGIVGISLRGINKETGFIWLWLIFSPLPAALTRDQIHAVRSFNMVIPLTILLSFGLKRLLSLNFRFKKLAIGSFLILYLMNYFYFLDAYFIHLPVHSSKYWEYGYKQIVNTVLPIQNNYKEIKIQQSYAQPYIYFLFYGAASGNQKYDPLKYQKQVKLTPSEIKDDVGKVENLDNICFCPIDWQLARGKSGTLFVGDLIRIPPGDSSDERYFKLIREIKYLNGIDTAFRIVEVK